MGHNQAVGHTHDDTQIEALQPGAKLLRGQYEILRFLNNGGFGITYLARDSLNRDVVIKECFPAALCRRVGDAVKAADPAYRDDLRSIIDMFIQEARNHARLVHPNIVDVHQVFEDNQTAYIAMDFIRGCDLLDFVQDPDQEPSPDFVVQVTEKMLSAVAFIHESGMLHRDISPDNILIDENQEPVLIDFGAAREQAANRTAALLTLRVIKDGYSPHEFYVRGAEQGPSSDLYVLAATLYHAISGERPIDGQTRLNAFNNSQPDPYTPLSSRFDGYPEGFLEAIDKAMEIHATDRQQSALEWLRMFRGPRVVFDNFGYRPVSVIVAVNREEEEELSEAEKERIKAETENAEAVVTALLAGNSDLAIGPENHDVQPAVQDEPVAVDKVIRRSDSGGGGKLITVAAVAVIAAVAGGYFVLSGNEDAPTEVAPVAEAPTAITENRNPIVAATENTDEVAVATEPETVPQEAVEQPAPQRSAEPEAVTAAQKPATEEPVAAEDALAKPVAAAQADALQAAAAPAKPVKLLEQQVSFAHWDVEIPFGTSQRRQSTAHVIAVTSVDPAEDMSVIGDWVQRGDLIYTLNGEPIRGGMSFAAQILDNFEVDPDGYIRVVARYRPLGKTRVSNGLLALPAVRIFGLENGLALSARNQGDDRWETAVTGVGANATGTLRQGDVLLREEITGQAISSPESLDKVLEALVADNQPEARLTVLRNGAENSAVMRLAEE
ncbi:serine/threonine-protein kinase [Ruegeria sp. HKCCD8929]|uniref:serine/threonine-protein kinase n=1 Tax=Ruegeria sp. HKCCD8929 TaxID=2683006 RepID=UPI001488C484|nr:serine/threonine-protein kinase [Ruegeria sp. HKCCD8929]